MIRQCDHDDFERIKSVINESACAYKGVIPDDCWKQPYMSREDLRDEINDGVQFWGYEEDGELIGVIGFQYIQGAALIRHAYVRTSKQNHGIGGKLLSFLQDQTTRPLLVGTWADAVWAVRFYEKHGFQVVSAQEKDRLLRKYWSIPDRQIETSVVLADQKWLSSLRW